MPETQIRLHCVGAKVHGPMLEPALLGYLVPFLRPKRQIGRDGEHFKSICLKFDILGVQAGVFGSRRTEAQDAEEHHDPFRADAASLLCRFRGQVSRIENHLQLACGVSQVKEQHSSMIPDGFYPAAEAHQSSGELTRGLRDKMSAILSVRKNQDFLLRERRPALVSHRSQPLC